MTTHHSTPNSRTLFAIREAAAELCISRSTLYRLIQSGDLQTVHIGRRCLIPQTSIDSFISSKLNSQAHA